ncbi:MAG: hypothetical protein QE263_05355 [Vampirovibrionales bacterium]|nr:hypothetical protein [Vampirovibrionales bacterium]
MIQFGTHVVVTNAFKKHYLMGQDPMAAALQRLGNPRDGRSRVLLLDVPANLPPSPSILKKFFAWLGIIKLPDTRGTVTILEGGLSFVGRTDEYLGRFNSNVKERFNTLKKQCANYLMLDTENIKARL